MNRDEYKAITRGQGAKVRALLKAATSRHADTSRSAILADLDDAGVTDDDQRAALVATYVDLAKKSRAEGASSFQLSQAADELAVKHVRAIRAADDLLGEDGIPEGEPDHDDDDTMVRHIQARVRGLNDEQFEQEEADRTKRAELARLGYTPAS